jgi:FkbM family methyltransferase
MLFSVKELTRVWGIAPIGVVHIGAHLAEESGEYSRFNWQPVTWFEAQSDLVTKLRESLNPESNQVYEATLWDEDDQELEFNVTNNGQSSSLLGFGKHAVDYPEIVVEERQIKRTIRFDSSQFKISEFDFVNLDVQGVELQVLKGMGERIAKAEWIYTEVNKADVYIGCVQISEMDTFLGEKGFKRVATRWCFGKGWGDALYSRNLIKLSAKARIFKCLNQVTWNTYQSLIYLKILLHKVILVNKSKNE